MNQFFWGIILLIIGLICTTIGGYVAKDGWDKWRGAKSRKITGDIQQTATGNGNIQMATTGDNSPIIIDNRKEVSSQEIQANTLCYNKLEESFFITKVELYSQNPIPNVYFAAYAKTIVEFVVKPQRAGISMTGHSGKRQDFWFTNIPNFGGKYLLVVKTRESEEIRIEYDI